MRSLIGAEAPRIYGQHGILNLLHTASAAGRLAHAYLLVGPPHVGKMTVALHLAQLVNCEDPRPGPCQDCAQCSRIASGHHADVQAIGLPVNEDGSLGTQVRIEQVRELRKQASLRPYEGRTRVFILQDAELLTTEAANSLLKYLEEPPPNVLLVLLTADEDALLPTVVSRCQRIELRAMPLPELERVLTADYGVEGERAALLSRLSGGCPGWAISAAQEPAILDARLEALNEQASLVEADLPTRFRFASSLGNAFYRDRPRVRGMLDLCQSWWMDLLLYTAAVPEQAVNVHMAEKLDAQAQGLTIHQAHAFLSDLARARDMLERNAIPRLALEWLMLKMPVQGKKAA